MSQTTASGAGGSAAPGWYTDPHDPSQLRWWSGEGWTEHTSGGSSQPSPQSVAPQVAQAGAGDPLPSRRALRDPATEASEAAEAAIQAQQAQQAAQAAAAQQAQFAQQQQAQALQAQQAQQAAAQQAAEQAAAQQAQFAAQQAQQAAQQAQFAAQQQTQQPAAPALPPTPQVASQPSPPAPTLPVQPKSFLEQAGYAPLDAVPADQAGWNPAAAQPAAAQQPVQQQQAPQQPAAPQYASPPPSAPVQPLQASAWDQAAQQANEYSGLAAAQNQWNQPAAQPGAPAAPAGWDAPPQAAPQPSDGIDSLFAGAPAAQAPSAAADPAARWALTPGGESPGQPGRRGSAREAEPQTAGSSTFWGWLIAISPILAAGSIGYVLVSTGYVLSGWPIEAAVAAPYLLVLLFALADRSALLNLGHSSPRSPGWALLSAPVYLIVRASETRREDGSGTALTLAWFFSVLVAIGGFVGYGFLTGHPLIAGLPS